MSRTLSAAVRASPMVVSRTGTVALNAVSVSFSNGSAAASNRSERAEHLDDSGLIGFGITGRDGGYVFVGQEDESLSELREALLATLAVASKIAVILSVGWGLLVAWLSFRRIDRMNAVAAQVMAGNMAPRMPVGRRGDEIDVLAVQLNHMLDQLGKVVEAIRQVSTDIAHDLRTPLSRLQRRLERLAQVPTAAERGYLINEALEESRRMLDVFASLLRISQIEGGGARRQFAPLDLSTMLNDIYQTYEPVFANSGQALRASIESGIETIGDRALLQQMFVNLLENIVAHTPTGTSAELILLRVAQGGWRATVRDDGPGIPVDHQDRVFTRSTASIPAAVPTAAAWASRWSRRLPMHMTWRCASNRVTDLACHCRAIEAGPSPSMRAETFGVLSIARAGGVSNSMIRTRRRT